jgi:hypothetical protein
VAANSTSYVDTTVTKGINYCYRVRAVNNAGASAYTNEVWLLANCSHRLGKHDRRENNQSFSGGNRSKLLHQPSSKGEQFLHMNGKRKFDGSRMADGVHPMTRRNLNNAFDRAERLLVRLTLFIVLSLALARFLWSEAAPFLSEVFRHFPN